MGLLKKTKNTEADVQLKVSFILRSKIQELEKSEQQSHIS